MTAVHKHILESHLAAGVRDTVSYSGPRARNWVSISAGGSDAPLSPQYM